MTPHLTNDPDHYEPGSVKYYLAAAEWWLKSAHTVSDDDDYYAGEDPADTDWTLQHLHATEQATMAQAHAAIAQAKIAAGWPVEA